MKLTKDLLTESSTLQLPEKVLQFGTGVLLRGLCDYFIDKANKQGVFNGRIVVVKSTDSGGADAFAEQDNLYTLCVRGIDKGVPTEENIICSAISRVLSAQSQWNAILETAQSSAIQVVISNTTEVGLQYVEESIRQSPPASFPAKLTAWLYERFQARQSGVVIIPTELIVGNGDKLKEIVLKLCSFNQLPTNFVEWLEKENTFCNSLVDRIVPGKPKGDALNEIQHKLGYDDELLAVAETYRLWAIQGEEKVKDVLTFATVDEGVKIAKDIEQYRELKLRMLNGTHTLMCGMAFLSGFQTVKEALADEMTEKFITNLMMSEIAPAIPYKIDAKVAQRYGRDVLDRFRNPYLDHQWISITLQYTMKMQMRNIPLLVNYYKEFSTVPQYFTRGFAAYLLFMKATKEENGKYFGEKEGVYYPIQCDSAKYFYEVWQNPKTSEVVDTVLGNQQLWGTDLRKLKGFAENVTTHLSNMMAIGVREVASALNVYA
ncbi:Altronate oxidoreductase [Emticicia aquatica]|jgi:tagaturonate reductase|uniref:Altronate oxidoreductase n=1 Tax=Emticicia aquatica TaxID=1681835 RepID=A0ABN8EVX4_9BACT|nr:tagaturonate reductase [Emticicia aquatica]CAH0997184.1 Altronate oxidoreductase [Emticicia aquatica]